ncbi:MAG: hypothetical protein M1817_000964 [Caeruleum heppii]|nr:MAG: hypothetical protein M1817_000964 [Caeruleum heppii]
MWELSTLNILQARPPPAEELIKAFTAFFKARTRTKEPLTAVQATHALKTFRHLQETLAQQRSVGLRTEDMRIALEALARIPHDETDSHNQLARALYAELEKRMEDGVSTKESAPSQDLLAYVRVLCQTGDTLDARSVAEQCCTNKSDELGREVWAEVLRGFVRENDEEQLLQTVSTLTALRIPFDASVHEIMTTFYAGRDDIEKAKTWFSRPITETGSPTSNTNAEILKFCLRNDELEWGDTVFRSTLDSNPGKQTWDIILQWAAALGKSVDDLSRMMDVMIQRYPNDEEVRPDIDTINALVSHANSRNDPFAAERYVTLGQSRGLYPNGRTHILQMKYRVKVNDIEGAKEAYVALQSAEVRGDEDVSAINMFIRALCGTKRPDYDLIQSIVSDLLERKGVRLESDTVAALAHLQLAVQDYLELHNLLVKHVYHFTLPSRLALIALLTDHITNRDISTTRAWETYTVMHEVFSSDLSSTTRTAVMTSFFARSRSDMAAHVFNHMNSSVGDDARPTVSSYTAAFVGLSTTSDIQSLELIHNTLKLDPALPDPLPTRLLNALMMAHTGCSLPDQALQFWAQILRSREGPSYSSVVCALRACEVSGRTEEGRKIWRKLESLGVEISREVAAGYVAVLGSGGCLTEAKRTIEGLEEGCGVAVDAFILGTLYSALHSPLNRDDIEAWIRDTRPELWTELVEQVGFRYYKGGKKAFRVERGVDP